MHCFSRIIFFSAATALLVTAGGGCSKSSSDVASDVSNDTGLVINEIVAKDPDGGADWIEFYNAGEEPVLLSEYSLTDDNGFRERTSLPDEMLAPDEFIVIQAVDEAPESGSDYVPFKLGSDDVLTLHKGNVIIDTLDWDDGDAPEGSSYGRFPDGVGDVMTLSPTPGAENE